MVEDKPDHETEEKRWLVDGLRHNFQIGSERLHLEIQDLENSIEKDTSDIVQFRNDFLTVVAFIATLIVTLDSISLVNKQVVVQVLFPDLIIGMVVYFVVNIFLFETEKVLSNIRGEYYLAENALSYIAGSFGVIPFKLEATTAGHLKLMNIYIMLCMNGYFGIVRAYSEASKSIFMKPSKSFLLKRADRYSLAIQTAYQTYKDKRNELLADPIINSTDSGLSAIFSSFESPLKGYEILWTKELRTSRNNKR